MLRLFRFQSPFAVLVFALSACAPDVTGPVGGPDSKGSGERVSADVLGAATPAADPAIAFGSHTGKPNHITYWVSVMNSDGSNQTTLVPGSNAPHPAWSPDGHSIAYHLSTYDIQRVDVSVVNGVPQASTPITLPITHNAFDIAWSPDAANPQIAYSESTPDVNAPGGIYLISTTPTPFTEQRVYLGPAQNRLIWLAWNPQATKIAFIQRCNPVAVDSLFVLDLTTSTATFIRSFTRGVMTLSWSRTQPDRLALALSAPSNPSGFQPAILDLTTNTLTNDPSGPGAKWSPDDSYLVYYGSQPNGARPVYKVNLATGVQTQLASDGFEPEWRRNP